MLSLTLSFFNDECLNKKHQIPLFSDMAPFLNVAKAWLSHLSGHSLPLIFHPSSSSMKVLTTVLFQQAQDRQGLPYHQSWAFTFSWWMIQLYNSMLKPISLHYFGTICLKSGTWRNRCGDKELCETSLLRSDLGICTCKVITEAWAEGEFEFCC